MSRLAVIELRFYLHLPGGPIIWRFSTRVHISIENNLQLYEKFENE